MNNTSAVMKVNSNTIVLNTLNSWVAISANSTMTKIARSNTNETTRISRNGKSATRSATLDKLRENC